MVEAVGKIETTLEDVAIYHDDQGKWWVRPVGNFLEEVVVDGQSMKRFMYLG